MKYARKCSFSGKGMNKGWYIYGEYYSTQEMADEVAAFNGCTNFDAMYKAEGGYECYYTEWKDEDDYQYEEINGVLTEIQ
jgi:hypothetical protein